ncbi:hypothetical protein CYY_008671 [Polysphondylium violaceum]|uniref:Ankyrin repeat-containing protein n=1 Tax=Polysphondylium violaceum TaxID=133409 RepID=A0A8J4PMM7_9MYCE|nr:hypothetical protein CYY_008671 [Polysphondylium violaceum]
MAKDIFKIARKGDVAKIKKYIPGKFKATDLDKENKSLLHHAIEGEQLAMVNYLIEQGADINLRNPSYDTPILMSLKLLVKSDKQEDIVILLVNKGADLDVESRERKSVDRYVEATPKRFQVKYKDAVQLKFKAKYQPKPASAVPLIPTVQPPPLQYQTGRTTSTTTLTTALSPPLASKPAIGVIDTVEQAPIINANGATVPRPNLNLDVILPKSLLQADYEKEKDITVIWLEVAYRASLVASKSEKVRHDDILLATNECGNILVHLLSIIGNTETTSFMEDVRNQESVHSIQERVKNLKDGIQLRLFSRIDHVELIRLVAALIGSLHWMYYCWAEVSREDIERSISECALSCRVAMSSASTCSPIPYGVLTNIAKLLKNISTKIFITRNPEDAKQLSDSCLTITQTFKSLVVSSVLNDQRDTLQMNIVTLAKSIAEQLSFLKSHTATLVPSRVGACLPADQEKELCESASRQLRGSIDYYKSNKARVQLPKEDTIIPLLASIQRSISQFTLFSTLERDLQICVPAQMLAQDINEVRSIILDYVRNNSETLPEDFRDQISNAINTCAHFATQLLFSVSALVCHNRITDFSQIGYTLRGISSCSCILVDSFCF